LQHIFIPTHHEPHRSSLDSSGGNVGIGGGDAIGVGFPVSGGGGADFNRLSKNFLFCLWCWKKWRYIFDRL
jgi:hypothetical protein